MAPKVPRFQLSPLKEACLEKPLGCILYTIHSLAGISGLLSSSQSKASFTASKGVCSAHPAVFSSPHFSRPVKQVPNGSEISFPSSSKAYSRPVKSPFTVMKCTSPIRAFSGNASLAVCFLLPFSKSSNAGVFSETNATSNPP